MTKINGSSINNHNYKINTSSSVPKTSFNSSLNQKITQNLRHSADAIGGILKHGAYAIPGAPIVSSAMSGIADAVSNGLSASGDSANPAVGTMESFQTKMFENQEKLLQVQATTGYKNTEISVKSSLIQAERTVAEKIASGIK